MYQAQELNVSTGLSGVQCREDFDRALSELAMGRSHRRSAVILVEIDFFGTYQFACGIAACDQCLEVVADCLLDTTRRLGAGIYAVDAGRFAVLLPEADEITAERVAREIHFQVEGLVIAHPRSPVSRAVSVSVGLAVGEVCSKAAAAELISEAEAALGAARAQGRNRVMRRPRPVCV